MLFWFAFALYCGASVLYAYRFLLKRPRVGWWATFLMGAGFICQTLSIGAGSIASGGTQLTGANQLVLVAWALALLYFVVEHFLKVKTYGAFLIPAALVLMALAETFGSVMHPADLTAVQLSQLASWRVAFHVALIVFANAGFAFSAVTSALYLIQGRQLKRRASGGLTWRLPSLESLIAISRRAISLAFPVYTAGLLFGVLRAGEEHVPLWFLDPRIMLAGIVWATFGVYLVAVYRRDVSGRTAARIALLGFVFVVALTILARVPASGGFHIFGL